MARMLQQVFSALRRVQRQVSALEYAAHGLWCRRRWAGTRHGGCAFTPG